MTKSTVIGPAPCDACGAGVEVKTNRYGRGYYRCAGCGFYATFSPARVQELRAAQEYPGPEQAPAHDPDPGPEQAPAHDPKPETDPDHERNPWGLPID